MTQYDRAGERRLFDERLYNGKMLGLAPRTWPLTPGIKRIAISYRRWSNDYVAEVVDVQSLPANPTETGMTEAAATLSGGKI
jgi:hypothetical protein